MPDERCPNCAGLLHGLYCSDCGQRRPQPDDYSTSCFLVDALSDLFSINGKTFRTARQLLFHPGRLTLDHFQGRRIQYLKPLQIFLIVNVLFVLFAIRNGMFDPKLDEYLNFSPPPQEFTRQLVTQRIAQKAISFEAYATAFDHNEDLLRKSLIVLLVPLFALVLWALSHRGRRYYAEHLVFSIHFFSFFWLFTTLTGWPIGFLVDRAGVFSDFVLEPLIGIATVLYLYLMLRTVYAQGRLITLVKACIGVAAVMVLLDFYRVLLFFGTYLVT